jgi:small-conductance mechanosensitive channel
MWSKFTEFFYSLPALAVNLIIAFAALFIGLLFQWALNRYLKHRATLTFDFSVMRSVVRSLTSLINFFLPLFLLSLSVSFMELGPLAKSRLDKLSGILVIVIVAATMISALNVAREYVYHRFDLHKSDNLRERKIRTQLQFLRRIIIVVIVFISVCLILLSFDSFRRIGTGLLTGVGVGGIIIGFAAQKSLGNLLAGFQIAFTQPIRLDDVLVVEGEWGRVEEITLTYVVLSIWDQRRLILPINYFIEKPFQNWTRTTAELLGTAFLYLDFTAPIEPLRAEFIRQLSTEKLWDGRVGVLQVTGISEHAIEIRALMSAKTSGDAFDLRCIMRESLIAWVVQNHPDSLPKTRAEFDKNFQPQDFGMRGV